MNKLYAFGFVAAAIGIIGLSDTVRRQNEVIRKLAGQVETAASYLDIMSRIIETQMEAHPDEELELPYQLGIDIEALGIFKKNGL